MVHASLTPAVPKCTCEFKVRNLFTYTLLVSPVWKMRIYFFPGWVLSTTVWTAPWWHTAPPCRTKFLDCNSFPELGFTGDKLWFLQQEVCYSFWQGALNGQRLLIETFSLSLTTGGIKSSVNHQAKWLETDETRCDGYWERSNYGLMASFY